VHWGKTVLKMASSAVSAFSTTAVATGISALESFMLKNELMEGSTDSSSLYLSTFMCSFLTARAVQTFQFIVDYDRIQIKSNSFNVMHVRI